MKVADCFLGAAVTKPNIDGFQLLDHEFAHLLEALRRDLRREQGLSEGIDSSFHKLNARMDVRLLEALQPKRTKVKAVEVRLTISIGGVEVPLEAKPLP